MFELLLMAQVAAGDMPCYVDFGGGPIDLTYMCGMSGGGLAALSEAPSAAAGSVPSTYQAVTFFPLPGVEACAQARADVVIESPDLDWRSGMWVEFLDECAEEVPRVATYSSPSGALEIVKPLGDEGFWVRVPDDAEGYGPFGTNSQAGDFARANFSQFF